MLMLAIAPSTAPSAKPQGVLEIGAIALGGHVLVSDLINQFESMADRVIGRAQDAGNAVVGRAGAELRLTTENLSVLIDRQQTTFFDQLRPELQETFRHMNEIISSIQSVENEASNLQELTALDIQESLNRIRFITDRKDFYISSIRGYDMLPSTTNHPLVIRGLGFGFNGKCDSNLTVGGVSIPPEDFVRGDDQFTLTVTVPDDAIKDKFDDTKLVSLPANFTCSIARGRKHYSIRFTVILLPRIAGYLYLSQYVKSDDVPTGSILNKTVSHTWNRDECSVDHPCLLQESETAATCVADDEVIVGVQYQCDGACGFCTSVRQRELIAAQNIARPQCVAQLGASLGRTPAQVQQLIAFNPAYQVVIQRCIDDRTHNHIYDPDYEIRPDKKCASVWRHYDADAVTTVTYLILYQKTKPGLKLIPDPQNPSPNPPLQIRYGESLRVPLDPNNPDGSFSATGKVIATNQTIDLNQASGDSGTPLRVVSVAKVGDHYEAVFALAQ
jgi:hypothetical protein